MPATSFKDLEPVDWLIPADEPLDSTWRTCDLCEQDFVDDAQDGRKPRQMFRVEKHCGLIVCERCIADYLLPEVPHA